MSDDRIPCLVPFCRRTAPARRFPPGTIIICGKHWPLAPKAWRRRYRLFRRRGRLDLARRQWDMIERFILERAAGIT